MSAAQSTHSADDGGEVMAAVEQAGERATLIIADVSCDDAWLTVPAAEAATLDTWR